MISSLSFSVLLCGVFVVLIGIGIIIKAKFVMKWIKFGYGIPTIFAGISLILPAFGINFSTTACIISGITIMIVGYCHFIILHD